MKRVLITGISGFAGSHLAESLVRKKKYEIYGTVFGDGYQPVGVPKHQLVKLNLIDREATLTLIKKIQPEWIFHLAALSSPAKSFFDPRETLTNNIEAQVNILDGALGDKKIERLLVIGSAEEYGQVTENDLPIDEKVNLNPVSPYAVSKIAQDFLGRQYFLSHQLPVIRVRPFNHTGERQAPLFVVPAFAKQIAEIEKSKTEATMKVGNLKSYRDFSDVKDMVEAYRLAMEQGKLGEVYNLGSGQAYQIERVLTELLLMSRVKIKVVTDPKRWQPSDVPKLVADSGKFKRLTGWQTTIPFSETLTRVLDYWRKQI
ncbi:hypothetical protein A2W24_00890 [Microgenomates group bacterium RBG_16_45_19]|mgnify:CR=1 FL=1|nr:MAG: hypothetical protein A2W24_00890 [Microgenomates group bacterium RBG_16_45_19]